MVNVADTIQNAIYTPHLIPMVGSNNRSRVLTNLKRMQASSQPYCHRWADSNYFVNLADDMLRSTGNPKGSWPR